MLDGQKEPVGLLSQRDWSDAETCAYWMAEAERTEMRPKYSAEAVRKRELSAAAVAKDFMLGSGPGWDEVR